LKTIATAPASTGKSHAFGIPARWLALSALSEPAKWQAALASCNLPMVEVDASYENSICS
jgi:hypothetical protein